MTQTLLAPTHERCHAGKARRTPATTASAKPSPSVWRHLAGTGIKAAGGVVPDNRGSREEQAAAGAEQGRHKRVASAKLRGGSSSGSGGSAASSASSQRLLCRCSSTSPSASTSPAVEATASGLTV